MIVMEICAMGLILMGSAGKGAEAETIQKEMNTGIEHVKVNDREGIRGEFKGGVGSSGDNGGESQRGDWEGS